MADELLEVTESTTLRREAAADRLRELADPLARHNEVYSVDVPDEVQLKVEIELGEESEIEVEISW